MLHLRRIEDRDLHPRTVQAQGHGFMIDTGGFHDRMQLRYLALAMARRPVQKRGMRFSGIRERFGFELTCLAQKGAMKLILRDIDSDDRHMQ